ncbi:MAG: peroxide stress protein YaaA [Holophagaceae bacterium]|nr:peroxide stress protein YaaA [Holophagaceae bacterium]
MKPMVLLAPSEEKASGGHTGKLVESPAQKWVREKLVELVVHGGPEACAKAFAVKDGSLIKACEEALALRHPVPLMAALERYQGVAFGALDAASLSKETWKQVFIFSNLRGLVRGDALVPPYKLKMGGIPGLKAHWRRHLSQQLALIPEGPLWELLPGEHADLLKGWSRLRHRLEIVDEAGKIVSHFSKLYRGRVARWILLHGQGAPSKVLRSKIEGCAWDGTEENSTGGADLKLVVLRGAGT